VGLSWVGAAHESDLPGYRQREGWQPIDLGLGTSRHRSSGHRGFRLLRRQ
jgi:hypothetical protein